MKQLLDSDGLRTFYREHVRSVTKYAPSPGCRVLDATPTCWIRYRGEKTTSLVAVTPNHHNRGRRNTGTKIKTRGNGTSQPGAPQGSGSPDSATQGTNRTTAPPDEPEGHLEKVNGQQEDRAE